jgi:hypothetical protein
MRNESSLSFLFCDPNVDAALEMLWNVPQSIWDLKQSAVSAKVRTACVSGWVLLVQIRKEHGFPRKLYRYANHFDFQLKDIAGRFL